MDRVNIAHPRAQLIRNDAEETQPGGLLAQQDIACVAQRLPRAAPFGDVGIQGDEAALRERPATQLDLPVARREGLAGAEIAGAQQCRPAVHFRVHIDRRAEIPGLGLHAQHVFHGHAGPDEAGVDARAFGKQAAPFHRYRWASKMAMPSVTDAKSRANRREVASA